MGSKPGLFAAINLHSLAENKEIYSFIRKTNYYLLLLLLFNYCEEFSLIIINCQCVKGVDNVVYVTSCQGVSNLSLLVSEMRRAFQKDTPLYARSPVQAPPPAGVQVSQSAGRSVVFI